MIHAMFLLSFQQDADWRNDVDLN